MRVKFKTGNSFEQTSAYILGARKDQKPRILMYGGIELEMKYAAQINAGKLPKNMIYKISRIIGHSFEVQASCHPLDKPVRHYIMTFPPEDREILEDSSKMRQIVQDYMKEQGMVNTQYLIVRHNNTDHPHVHILFNPVNNNLEVINESRQFKKNEKLCKALTKKYGLHFSNPRDYTIKDYDKIPKHEQDKARVRCSVENALRTATSVSEFSEMLKDKHILVQGKFVEKDGKKFLQGLLFHYRAPNNKILHFKASQLSRSLTEKVIVDILKQNRNKVTSCVDLESKEPEKANDLSVKALHQVQPPKRSKPALPKKKPKSFGPKM